MSSKLCTVFKTVKARISQSSTRPIVLYTYRVYGKLRVQATVVCRCRITPLLTMTRKLPCIKDRKNRQEKAKGKQKSLIPYRKYQLR